MKQQKPKNEPKFLIVNVALFGCRIIVTWEQNPVKIKKYLSRREPKEKHLYMPDQTVMMADEYLSRRLPAMARHIHHRCLAEKAAGVDQGVRRALP